jgi:hypothetical protein
LAAETATFHCPGSDYRPETQACRAGQAGALFAKSSWMSDTTTQVRMAGVRRQEIAARAFEIYQRRLSSNQHGSSHDDWLQAERELWQERFSVFRRGA